MSDKKHEEKKGYSLYAGLQMLKYVVGVLVVMVIIGGVLSFLEKRNPELAEKHEKKNESVQAETELNTERVAALEPASEIAAPVPHEKTEASLHAENQKASEQSHIAEQGQEAVKSASAGHAKESSHSSVVEVQSGRPAGWAFVEGIVAPIEYELTKRFYGWRVNDIIQPTDNVESIQLGVLEVTRRSVEVLTERIAKTGSNQSFDRNLSKARSNFNYSPYKFWLPSAESEYRNGIKELDTYKKKLGTGEASFYTRSDNLIYLLDLYRSILGSCEEDLVKIEEEDGTEVSFFKSDDYFYYAQGVAIAMCEIMKAVAIDYEAALKSRNSMETVHHAIEVLEHAQHIHPMIILDSDYGSFFANHRANMAAPIGHAKFYLGVLIRSLST